MKLLTELFAWWTGNTIGTRLYTWRYGTRVGSDAFGNTYYQTGDGKRRWVVYRNLSEASLVPPEWHGWLHYTVDVPPTEERYKERPWERPYEPNLTGTPGAYRPPGSLLNPDAGKRPLRDYEPWQPS
jgi:NADH:ubiquinone oxidoreductase subunit